LDDSYNPSCREIIVWGKAKRELVQGNSRSLIIKNTLLSTPATGLDALAKGRIPDDFGEVLQGAAGSPHSRDASPRAQGWDQSQMAEKARTRAAGQKSIRSPPPGRKQLGL